MQLQTWTIQGRGAFHFGEHGIGQETSRITWPSDSLFAALIARLVALRGADGVEAWLGTSEQPQTPPFLLTSTFPYAGEVRFFPLPRAALRGDASPSSEWRPKDLKKVRFVSKSIYRALLDGTPLAAILQQSPKTLHDRTVLLTAQEFKTLPGKIRAGKQPIWSVAKRPRVAVGRVSSSSNLFHVGAVHFAEDCGLWFGVQWLTQDKAQHALLKSLLEDLGDAGLGAERSSGYGQAEIKKGDDLTLPDPHGGAWTTLSRYLPAEDETPALRTETAAYTLERVGGWMDSHGLRRRAVNLLAEGAVLGPLDKPAPYGCAVDVRPIPQNEDDFAPVLHPVWRVGMAVAVGYGGAA